MQNCHILIEILSNLGSDTLKNTTFFDSDNVKSEIVTVKNNHIFDSRTIKNR